MSEVFICDAIRTPFGRYGGSLAAIRTDDLAALPVKALMERNPCVDWGAVDDVVFGCANQAGEDNRNVARMALLLAGLPKEVPGATATYGAIDPSDLLEVFPDRHPAIRSLHGVCRNGDVDGDRRIDGPLRDRISG